MPKVMMQSKRSYKDVHIVYNKNNWEKKKTGLFLIFRHSTFQCRSKR